MRTFFDSRGFRLALVAPLSLLLTHCGDDSSQPSGAADGSAKDAYAGDAGVADGSTDASDASLGDAADASLGDASDASLGDAADASLGDGSDASLGDAADASLGDGGAADASLADAPFDGPADAAWVDAAVPRTPCQADAGDAGDGGACPGTQSCCSGFCTDTAHDPANCGACGNGCTTTQFCSGVACKEAIFSNVCANPKATVAQDGYVIDNEAGASIAAGLATACSPPVTVSIANGSDPTQFDQATGRPLFGPGTTLVAGGGPFGQASVGYIDDAGVSAVRYGGDADSAWFQNTATMQNIIVVARTALNISHDYFLLELTVEPLSGTLGLFGIGITGTGTTAAGYYAENVVIPNRATYTNSWYIYEYTDTDMNGVPSAGDTFTLVPDGQGR